jgi:large subunit ribosomal protein L32
MRRAHIKASEPALTNDENTGETHLRHNISPKGFYKGKKVISIKEKSIPEQEQE